MITIPVSLTQEQFEQYIRPCLSVAKRGYECRIPLYKIFNYILYRLHTGCQWERLPIDNKRSRKKTKRGPKRLFSPEVYKLRFSCLPGSTIFVPCWCALTAKQLISWAHISSFTPSSISVTYSLRKSLNEFLAPHSPVRRIFSRRRFPKMPQPCNFSLE